LSDLAPLMANRINTTAKETDYKQALTVYAK
jgi:hypothetical protein